MADPRPRPGERLARALEELLRASADAVALWREHAAREGPELEPLERAVRGLERALDGGPGGFVDELRRAVRAEVARWDARADGDPAAAQVRDVFAALDDVLAPEREPPRARGGRPRRRAAPPPRR